MMRFRHKSSNDRQNRREASHEKHKDVPMVHNCKRHLHMLPIKLKLMIIIMTTSSLMLLLASVTFMAKYNISSASGIRQNLRYLAQVVGLNSQAALAFGDPETAQKNLEAFSAIPDVIFACIYDAEGRVFATYTQADVDPEPTPPPVIARKKHHEKGAMLVFQDIFIENELIGTVFIRHCTKQIWRNIIQSVLIVILIMCLGFMMSLKLSRFLQRLVSEPIQELTTTAKTITEEKNYAARAAKRCYQDEIGTLVDCFNEMLTEIQLRDSELEQHRGHLEEEVAHRTAELQNANDQLLGAKEAAEAANRAKSEFLASMSHEIRTPMNAVLGFTELLQNMVQDKRQKSYVESIQSSGKSLLTLINDILDLSKIEARKMDLQYEPVNPDSVFNEIHHIFSLKIAEKGLDFIIDIDPDIPNSLLLDEVRMRQVLFNLIGNAVKFTSKGAIRLFAKKLERPGDDSLIDLMIAVEDTGIGIPAESIGKIFDAFQQQDGQSTKRFGGTGLGLAITKRLVEMMAGTITVESELGKGSRFEIIFGDVSLAATPASQEIETTSDYESIVFEKATVLIVDDIETNRNLLKAYFTDTEIVFVEAEDGLRAIQQTRLFRPDLILMDIRMPIMDGYEATKQIRRDKEIKYVPIIALTASGMKEDRERSARIGFDGFLTKPVKKSELFKELSRFLKHAVENTIETAQPITDDKIEGILPETAENLPGIIEKLETEFTPRWEKARNNGFFDEIGIFGDSVRELGKRFSLEMLREFGDNLTGYCENFDIENMNALMNSFPELVEKMKRLRQKQGEGQ